MSQSTASSVDAGVDPIEIAACRTALLEGCARPGCDVAALVERLNGIGFPPLPGTWALVWSKERDTNLEGVFLRAGIDPFDLLERLVLATPGASARKVVESRLTGEVRAEELDWILARLAEHGGWREVDLVLSVARRDVTWIGLDPIQMRDEVVVALSAILERDPNGHAALRSCVEGDPEGHGELVLEALVNTTGERTLATLAVLLDEPRLETSHVLSAIETVGRRSLPPFEEYLLGRLRELARADDEEQRAVSLRALGALGDEASLPQQIEGLGDESGAVRTSAGFALAELTGLRLGPSQDRWRSWLAAETDWWEQRAPHTLERLREGDPAATVAALAEVVPHRLHRSRLARAVAQRLDDESPELRRLACLTLEQLGARAVATDLAERLSDVDEGVRESAGRCLRTLFGTDLPDDHAAWVDHLARGDLALR